MNETPPAQPESTELSPSANAAKIARLRRTARKYRRISHFANGISTLGMAGSASVGAVFNGHAFGSIVLFAAGGMAVNISGGIIELKARAERRKAIEELTKGADISIIGLLIDELDMKLTLDAVQSELTVLLPRLQATDAPLITPDRHRFLNRALTCRKWLKNKDHADLLRAILKAYEQVGNSEDFPAVERLALGKGYAKRDREIREAAQACLPFLQARSEQQEARQTLLRASSASADYGANLLRPAHGANNTESAQLLRASNSETAE